MDVTFAHFLTALLFGIAIIMSRKSISVLSSQLYTPIFSVSYRISLCNSVQIDIDKRQ